MTTLIAHDNQLESLLSLKSTAPEQMVNCIVLISKGTLGRHDTRMLTLVDGIPTESTLWAEHVGLVIV